MTLYIKPLAFRCQKVLPLEFDDSLSYYEAICKIAEKLNETISATDNAFNQLETDVNAKFNNKQDTLVSGENIKTVNGQSILGSGNVEIDTGGTDVEGNPTGDTTDGDLAKIKIGSKIFSIHNYTDAINNKQDTLVSGQNIKTVNGQSILGSGNVEISAGEGTYVEGNPTGDDTDGDLAKIKIGSKIFSIHNYTDAINNKQDTLVSGTNIKTINGNSVLGSGNISIETGVVDMPTISGSFPGSEQNHYTIKAQKTGLGVCNMFISVDFYPNATNEIQSFEVKLPAEFAHLDGLTVTGLTDTNAHWERGCWDACSSIIDGWAFNSIDIDPFTKMLSVSVKSVGDYQQGNGMYKMSYKVAGW